jgi:hypothetical protein
MAISRTDLSTIPILFFAFLGRIRVSQVAVPIDFPPFSVIAVKNQKA